MKIALICTVYNEESTIQAFVDSVFLQTRLPDELIIVDGGSNDATVRKLGELSKKYRNKKISFYIISKIGNRAVGRNEAVRKAKSEIIACSDAGNILDTSWLKNIAEPFTDKHVDVVAGYYKGKFSNVFQQCVVPYVLVMPDKVKNNNFLPATRSIAFRKQIWDKVGGFDENFSHNEDYIFALSLQKIGANIYFEKNAIVYWFPRNSIKSFFTMLWRFAYGDVEAGVIRTKVLLLFARYFLALYWLFLCVLYRSKIAVFFLIIIFILYILWSIIKNYKYIKQSQALLILPILQFTADFAVLSGSLFAIVQKIKTIQLPKIIFKYKMLVVILFAYILCLLSTIYYGIPNLYHPFPYNMDEWHQFHAVGTTFTLGTPNTPGSANGTILSFFFDGIYLVPFIFLHIISPFHLSLTDSSMREKIFQIARLNTIIWGVLSIILLYSISTRLKIPRVISISLFTVTPVWVMLSGFFKYDIDLMFWILLSLLFILNFSKFSTVRNYILAALPVSLAFDVKVSAVPLILIYLCSFFWFLPNWKRQLKYFLLSIILIGFLILLFGMPDLLFNKGNIVNYLYNNIIQSPGNSNIYKLGMPGLLYVFIRIYPLMFGVSLLILFLCAFIYLVFYFIRNLDFENRIQKVDMFIVFSFIIFLISLLPLKIYASGNRSLVLLPFFVLIIGIFLRLLLQIGSIKYAVYSIIVIIIFFQVISTFQWYILKIIPSPQQQASMWIIKNIKKNQLIGVENIPIYQNLPDIIEKEFYYQQYLIKGNYIYKYEVVNTDTKQLPAIVIITNEQFIQSVYKSDPTLDLISRLRKEHFQKVIDIKQQFPFSKINPTDENFSSLMANPTDIAIYKKM